MKQFRKLAVIAISSVAVLLIASLAANAQLTPSNPPPRVSLAWNASASTGVAGYNLYQGSASRFYTNKVDVGSSLAFTVNLATRGVTNYFAVTAYSTNGLESQFSNEIAYVAPLPPLAPTLQLAIVDGKLMIRGSVDPYQEYELLRTQDFEAWTPVATNRVGNSTELAMADPNPPADFAFYRIAAVN